MAVKNYRPTSAGRRFVKTPTFEEVTKTEPEKSLLVSKKKNAGRNSYGRITVRHQGGGNRQKYRIIDFKRNKDGISAKVVGIEYDPNRTAYIALLSYADGEKRYILSPIGLKVGDTVMSGEHADVVNVFVCFIAEYSARKPYYFFCAESLAEIFFDFRF